MLMFQILMRRSPAPVSSCELVQDMQEIGVKSERDSGSLWPMKVFCQERREKRNFLLRGGKTGGGEEIGRAGN